MYNGRCPLCSGELKEQEGRLICVKGHYECRRSDFEAIWDRWDKIKAETGVIDGQSIVNELVDKNLKRCSDGDHKYRKQLNSRFHRNARPSISIL